MLYTELNIGEKEYKLRLDARGCVALERKLGKSPLSIFMQAQEGSLPTLEQIILILQASMQKFHSGITENNVYDLYDAYIEQGNTFTDLISVVLEIFKVSGFFKEEDVKNPKN